MSSYTFGTVGCTHIGYTYKAMQRRNRELGVDQRIADGYLANQQVFTQMIDAGCRGVLHGGDVFHWSKPLPRDIETVHRVDDARYDAGLWAVVNTGNHDAGASADMSAVAVLDRPTVNSASVYVHDTRPTDLAVGPYPGLYEIHQPDPDRQIYLHVVSHFGLDRDLREAGIIIDPQPLDHGINILCSHGIFVGDTRLYRAVERHGAERLIPTEWVTRGWDVTLLSDFHTPGPVDGFGDPDGRGQVWYTGSTLRRGFSDEATERGWLKVEIPDQEAPQVSLQSIWQRPQLDFEPIDATGLTVSEINDRVRDRLTAQSWVDDTATERSGDGGWILRQTIRHASAQQKQGINELRGHWAKAASAAASWHVDFDNPLAAFSTAKPRRVHTTITDRVTDFQNAFDERLESGNVAKTLRDAPEPLRGGARRRAREAIGAPRRRSSAA